MLALNSSPAPPTAALQQAIGQGDYSEVDTSTLAKLFRRHLPDLTHELLENFPIVQIVYTDGSTDVLSALDLIDRGVWEYERCSFAFNESSILCSFEWASGQGCCSYLWNPQTQRILWGTDEIAGLCAKLPGTDLFVIHQCFSSYAAPPTNWLLVLAGGQLPSDHVIPLDNVRWICSPPPADLWTIPRVSREARDPTGKSYEAQIDATVAARLQNLAGSEVQERLAWDPVAEQLVISTVTLDGEAITYLVGADELLAAVDT